MQEFARAVLEQAAPEELAIFDETSEEYFSDPQSVLTPGRRDEAVGFGLDVALLTPYVLAVATPVLSFLLDTVVKTTKQETTPVIADLVRRFFRRLKVGEESAGATKQATSEVHGLTKEQAATVREVALARAADLGLPEGQARLLADSVIGGLVVTE
jgi:hypothetical protein